MWAPLPDVDESTARPGMKWSTLLLTESIGTRDTELQFWPSVEVLMTMSFEEQPRRNRQSCQTTYTLPAPSISAEGSESVRSPPRTACGAIEAIVNGPVHETPPLVERSETTLLSLPVSIGMTTVPFGWTT